MERLIMEFSVGDGYTYSADVTYPIVYSSKKEAIDDFELLLIEKVDTLSSLYKQRQDYYEDFEKIRTQIQKVTSDKRMSDKDKEKKTQSLYQSYADFREDKLNPLEEKIQEAEKVSFGGQIFPCDNFIYKKESDNKMDYCLPSISTLDEYFSSIEHNLSQTKKMKI